MNIRSISSIVLLLGSLFTFAFPSFTQAQSELLADQHDTIKAQVIEVVSEELREVVGTNTRTTFQVLRVEILEGNQKGAELTVENDYIQLREGETFYLLITTRSTGEVVYTVSEPYRLNQIYFYTILFIVLVLIFGGMQGIRGLLSLAGSLLLIFYILLPQLLAGYSPVLVSMYVSALIIVVGSYITHGFNRTTSSAVIGMIITVVITGTLAYVAVDATRLTGFASEEAVYLNLNTDGKIDMSGLLLGAIMIGLLGVLYDAAISQSITVEELIRAAPQMSKRKLFERAMRVGREHIGALIDTLAIAYVGAALPLLLWFYSSSTSTFASIINREEFATEIIRTLIGSTGLILAVPITSFIAVIMLKRKGYILKPTSDHHHSHSHGHSHGSIHHDE